MLMLIMGIAPILAPVVGAQILAWVGWRGIFVTITLCGIALLWTLSKVMVETLAPEKQIKLSWGNIFRTYGGLLLHWRFMAFALSGGLASATMFSYIVGSPRLFIEHFGVSPQTYGLLFGMNAASLDCGIPGLRPTAQTSQPHENTPLGARGDDDSRPRCPPLCPNPSRELAVSHGLHARFHVLLWVCRAQFRSAGAF